MSLWQRIILFGWAGVAVLLLVIGIVELWLLTEGAVRKPHNSRLMIVLCFAVSAAVIASVIGTWRGRTDGINALQIFSLLTSFFGLLYCLASALELSTLFVAEVRERNWISEILGLLQGLLWIGFALATRLAFRESRAKPNG